MLSTLTRLFVTISITTTTKWQGHKVLYTYYSYSVTQYIPFKTTISTSCNRYIYADKVLPHTLTFTTSPLSLSLLHRDTAVYNCLFLYSKQLKKTQQNFNNLSSWSRPCKLQKQIDLNFLFIFLNSSTLLLLI